MLTDVVIAAVSANRKTGPMPTISRPFTTCPTSCAFLPRAMGGSGECYANGRLQAMVAKHAKDVTTADAIAKLRGARRDAQYLRDRVVGDVALPDGSPDMAYLADVAEVATAVGLVAYGYTHVRTLTAAQVATVAASGYVLNASCETVAEVETAVELGMPVVIAGDAWQDGDIIAGRRVTTCPEQLGKVADCASCGLCARQDRKGIVRFLMH